MKYLALFLTVLSVQACDKVEMPLVDYTYSITFKNDSRDSVAPFLAYGGWGYENAEGPPYAIYPDTLLPKSRPVLMITAGPGIFIYNASEPWNKLIDEVPNDTISLYVLDADVYRDSSWSTIRSKYLYLKRYSIAASEVGGSNYEIVYDGL